MIDKVYTQSDFARRIGRHKNWVSDKIRRHVARNGYGGTLEFNGIDGKVYVIRLFRNEGALKWLICIVE